MLRREIRKVYGLVRKVYEFLDDRNINEQSLRFFMVKKRAEWTFKEYIIPSSISPHEFAKLSGVKIKPLTKKEQALWNYALKELEEARKWNSKKNR